MPNVRSWLGLVALCAVLGGCGGRYYWSKSAGSAAQFDVDSRECAAEAAPRSAPGDYVVFRPDAYRACVAGRGWVRAKQSDPPPPGWFRGYE